VPDLVRIVAGRRGTVEMDMELIARFDYGSIVPWVRKTRSGLRAIAGPDQIEIQTPVPMHGKGLTTVARFTIHEGDRVPFVLQWQPSHEEAHLQIDAEEALRDTETWWREWSEQCTYEGTHHDLVMRSLITLKALTYAPTGGIVAAATTSLPEKLGGVRNWDYRLCWLRDATFTLSSLLMAGFRDEALAWRSWLLRAVAGDPSQINIMYGLAGERRLPEMTLKWLPGYEGSAPVRIGNAAWEQLQLDIFGEVIDSLHMSRKAGLEASEDAWRLEIKLLDYMKTIWREPDEGIWEVRGPRRHFTHSKVMAWVAADRMVKSVEQFGLDGPVDEWRALRDEIHEDVCRNGFNRELNAFVQYYGATEGDASLLTMPVLGFLPPDDPRIRGTIELVERTLMRDGFVERYRSHENVEALPPGEGAFLPSSFALADCYCLLGRYDEAYALFDRLCALTNDVGLLSEEYDPAANRLVGNFPQAITHVALVNTAMNLGRGGGPAERRRR
jgi:GH15 family glucan-1,4-alpha-glucosidase